MSRRRLRLDAVVDSDEDGGVVGSEIDLASSKVNLKRLDSKGLLTPELLSK